MPETVIRDNATSTRFPNRECLDDTAPLLTTPLRSNFVSFRKPEGVDRVPENLPIDSVKDSWMEPALLERFAVGNLLSMT